jgi:hypothetical protein
MICLNSAHSNNLREAPANKAIEYEVHTFSSSSVQEPTIYLGPPNDDVDRAWEDIYDGQ